MKFLSLDTSTQYSVVSVCDENGLLYGLRCVFEKGRTEKLWGLFDQVLQKADTPIEALDGFGVSTGPGSFTGLRIGLAVIKGFAYALKKPCYAFSSLDAIAFNPVVHKKKTLCVCVDAKRTNVYCRFYKAHPGSGTLTKGIAKECLLSAEALYQKDANETIFTGDALKTHQKKLHKKFPGAQFASEESWYPTPESISALTLEQVRLKKKTDCFKLKATYLYEQDCQVRRV